MADSETLNPISIGVDDGYAFTKIAMPDGRLIAIPSRARIGRSNVTWLNGSEQRVFEYEADDTLFAVGEVEGEPTHFDGYPFSGLNRAIVQHALHEAGLAGQSVHAVSGLPVSRFYLKDGDQRLELIERKRASLKQAVQPIDGRLPAAIAFHEVIPEALAAWYDHIISEANGGVQLEAERLGVPVAVIDIGGRTTDFVVVADQRRAPTTAPGLCVVVCWTSNARSHQPSVPSSTSRSCPSARPTTPCVAAASACSARRMMSPSWFGMRVASSSSGCTLRHSGSWGEGRSSSGSSSWAAAPSGSPRTSGTGFRIRPSRRIPPSPTRGACSSTCVTSVRSRPESGFIRGHCGLSDTRCIVGL